MARVRRVHDRSREMVLAYKVAASAERIHTEAITREFSWLAQMQHGALPQVFDLGRNAEGIAAFTMECVEGRPAAPGDPLEIAGPLLEALGHLHRRGCVSLDLKPDNVLCCPGDDRRVVLVDLGLARSTGERIREITGTLPYFAPEILRTDPVDGRADLYALGVLLVFLASGELPFESTGGNVLAREKMEDEGAIAERGAARVPSPWRDFVSRLLSALPERRFVDAREARAALPVKVSPVFFRGLDLVERESALDRIGSVAGGRGKTFVVAGDEGAGVSRLLHVATQRAQLAGDQAMFVDGKSRNPLGRICHGLLPFDVGAPLDPDIDRVGWISAQLRDRDVPARVGLDLGFEPSQESRRAAWILESVVDDLPLALVFGCRAGERVSDLTLEPLSRNGVEVCIGLCRGEEGADVVADEIHRATGGNPRFLAEMLAVGVAVPKSLLDAMDGRLDSAGKAAAPVLELLAVAGGPLDESTLMAGIGAENTEGVRARLRDLAGRGLVAERSRGWVLALPAHGQRILERLAPDRAKDLHAILLEHTPGSDAEAHIRRSRHADFLSDGARALGEVHAALERMDPAAPLSLRRECLERALHWETDEGRREEGVDSLAVLLADAGDLGAAFAQLKADRSDGDTDGGDRRRILRAEIRFRRGDLDGADDDLAPVAARANPADPIRTMALLWQGRVLARRGDHRGAVEAADSCVASESPDLVRKALNLRGAARLALGERDGARGDLEHALELVRAVGEPGEEAGVLNNLGLVDMADGCPTEAAENFQASHELRLALGDAGNSATACDNLGVALLHTGDTEGAVAALDRALLYRERIGAPKGLSDSHNNLGVLHFQRGDLVRARFHHERALDARRELGAISDVARSLNNLAILDGRDGDLSGACSRLEESILLKERLDDDEGAAVSRVNLASLLWRQGRLDDAERVYAQAAGRASGDTAVAVLEGRALVDLARGDADGARAWADEALRRADPGSERRNSVHFVAADAAAMAGDFPSAIRLVSEVLGTDANTDQEAGAQRRLAAYQLRLGAVHRAVEHQGRAWTALRRGAGTAEEGECHRTAGEILLARGRVDEALVELKRAVEILDREGAQHGAASARVALGRALEQAGDTGGALETLEDARRTYDRIGNERKEGAVMDHLASIRGERDRGPEGLEVLRRLGAMLTSLGNPDELLEQTLVVVLETIGAERGQIFTLDEGNGELEVRVSRNMDPETSDDAAEYSRTILTRSLESGNVLFSENAQRDEDFRHFKSVARYQIVSFICVPLVSAGRSLGTIYVDNRSVVNSFSSADADFLQVFASLAGVALDNATLQQKLVRENRSLQQTVREEGQLPNVVGRSPAMRRVAELVRRVADTRSTVLIQGETGTGKEVVARAVHFESPWAERPFVAVDCGALQPTLIESELFGHKRGAFSGAVSDKPGLFEEADGGTIFLDEITNLDMSLQAKLLRVIQEGEFRRLGDTASRSVDVRIVCATNLDLRKAVDESRFREDLFFRINIVAIALPALRDRRDDIPLLAAFFLGRMEPRLGRMGMQMAPEVRDAFLAYHWPGNVRELENTIEGMVVMCEGNRLGYQDLPPHLLAPTSPRDGLDLAGNEQRSLVVALEATGWIQTRAAARLGISERVLRYKMKKHGIRNPRRSRSEP